MKVQAGVTVYFKTGDGWSLEDARNYIEQTLDELTPNIFDEVDIEYMEEVLPLLDDTLEEQWGC